MPILPNAIPDPWQSFLSELDNSVDTQVRLDCMGGFVLAMCYGLNRSTADIDVLEIAPASAAAGLQKLGSRNGPLHHRYGIYLDRVGVAHVPDNYEDRLTEIFPGSFVHLRLMAFDPYDLALSKLERNSQKDRDDVKHLARVIPLDLDLLQARYQTELRWQMGVPDREDGTLKLWIDAIQEERSNK